MKYLRLFLLVGMLIFLSSCMTTWADIPKLINFQGILTDGSGNPLADTTVSVEFKIYDDPSAGSVKWSETQASVSTDASGRFNVLLGSVTPVPDTAFTGTNRWLGIKVGSDAEMTPRQRLVSMPYSYEFDDTGPDSIISAASGPSFSAKNSTSSSDSLLGARGLADNPGSGVAVGGHFYTSDAGTGNHTGIIARAEGSGSFVTGVSGSARNAGSGDAFAGNFLVEASGTGDHTGVKALGQGGSITYGLRGFGQNTSSGDAYGGWFNAYGIGGTGRHFGIFAMTESGSGINYASFDSANGSSSSPTYGIYSAAHNSSSGDAYGGFFKTTSSGSGAHFGLRSEVAGSGNTYGLFTNNGGTGTLNYGVTATVSGAGTQNRALVGTASGGTGLNYGVFASAAGTNAYAGKFEDAKVGIGNAGTQNIVDGDGDLYVEDELEVDGDVHLDDNTLRVLSAASLVTMGSDTVNTQASRLYVNRTENTASPRTALYVQAQNSSSGGTTGIFSHATASPAGSGPHFGVSGIAGGTSGNCFGVDGEASGTGTNFGVYGTVGGGTTNYAVYGEAPTGTNNYSGYFTGNKVRLATNAGASTSITIGDRWRDNAIVAWGVVTSGSILSQEFGVSSFVNDSTGVYTITLDASAASSLELVPTAIAEIETPSSPRVININQVGVNQFQVFIFSLAGARVNNDFVFMVAAR